MSGKEGLGHAYEELFLLPTICCGDCNTLLFVLDVQLLYWAPGPSHNGMSLSKHGISVRLTQGCL